MLMTLLIALISLVVVHLLLGLGTTLLVRWWALRA
jgi:Flp pilus assembly pilin Flp